MSDSRPAYNQSDSGPAEDSGWLFIAVGLNGGTRTVRVEQLRGAVRLLTPADRSGAGLGGAAQLPHAFIWNQDVGTFEPIEPETPE
jgi:hypothetical protein